MPLPKGTEVTTRVARSDAAEQSSPLPTEPRNGDELDAWLVALRRRSL